MSFTETQSGSQILKPSLNFWRFGLCSRLRMFKFKEIHHSRELFSEAIKMIIGIDLNLTSEHVQILIDFVSNLALCVRIPPRPVLPVFISRVLLHQSPLSVSSFIISQSIKDVSTCSSDIGRNTASKKVGVSGTCLFSVHCLICTPFFLKICNEKIAKRSRKSRECLRGHQCSRLWGQLFCLM